MKVAFHTLGCKVNQYETEAMKEAFASRGAEIVPEDETADVYVVNTCTVTNIADRKSRQYIRRMKAVNQDAFVVVTGCYAQVEPDEVYDLPEVDLVVGNGSKSKICDLVFEQVRDILVKPGNELTNFESMGLVVSSESGMTRAYIKIQEGCDRFCSYCLIPFARGPVRSRSMQEILEEANMLVDAGYKELVLTGINTALFGTEQDYAFDRRSDEEGLTPMEVLLGRLNEIDKDFRIRLSSLEPTVVDKNDVEKIIRYDKLCHHLHLSVQSGSSDVLKLMNRRYTQEEYLEIVNAIHKYDPLYNITTDIIVGFSGESEDNFKESLKVVEQSEFGKVHVFRYSKRKGTVGERLADEVSGTVKAERASVLAELAGKTAEKFFRKNFGHRHRVLVEEMVTINRKKYYTGYTGNYIRSYIRADECDGELVGAFVDVTLCDILKDGCLATLVV